jgi:hypothetical protein
LLGRRIVSPAGTAQARLHIATRKGILHEPPPGLVGTLKQRWLAAS